MQPLENILDDFRIDYVGVNSIFGAAAPPPVTEPNEVWLRVSARSRDEEAALTVSRAFSDIGMAAPLGAGGGRAGVRPVVGVYSTTVPRERVETTVAVNPASRMTP